jgi:hypothetical protein
LQTCWRLKTRTVNKRFSASVDETVPAASGKGRREEWRQGHPRDVVLPSSQSPARRSLAKGRRGPSVQPRHTVKLQDGLERAVQMSPFPQPPATSSRPAPPRRHPKPSRVQPSFSAITASSRSTAGNPLAEQACDLRRPRSGRPLIRHSRGNTTPILARPVDWSLEGNGKRSQLLTTHVLRCHSTKATPDNRATGNRTREQGLSTNG